ncbi:MAG TPA: energy transducer TonB [Terriglobales bacterium]|nr:energy transducer TonB [Terriglobales bacterium]
MFEDSLIDSEIKTHRGATSAFAFALQVLVIAIIVVIPLIFTKTLPLDAKSITMLVAPPPPPPPPPPPAAAAAHVQRKTTPVTVTHELTQPLKIPQKIAMVHEAPAQPAVAPSVTGVVGGVPGGVPGGQIGGVLGGVMGGVGSAVPNLAAPKKVRISQGVSEGLLVHKVTPQYPAVAKSARIQGAVVLQAVIGKDGKVQNLQVIKGQPMLTEAAVNAVKQWQYKPYYLNGSPVEVETTITVDFRLNA